MIYLLTAIRLSPGGSSTVHIYTRTLHRTTQSTKTIHRKTQFTNQEECGLCPVFARYTLAFALQLRKKHGKTSVKVAGKCQSELPDNYRHPRPSVLQLGRAAEDPIYERWNGKHIEVVVACFKLTCECYATAKKNERKVLRKSGLRRAKFHTPTLVESRSA